MGLSIGEQFIFWTERCPDEDRLRRVPIRGGGKVETLSAMREKRGLFQLVAVHDDVVFWVNGTMWYRPMGAIDARQLTSRVGGIGFHVLDGSLYWCTLLSGIERVTDLAHGAIETVSSADHTLSCLIDDHSVWRWAPSQRTMHLLRSERGGSGVETEIWLGFLRGPFIKCGSYAYWAGDGGVFRLRDGARDVELVRWSLPGPHANEMSDSAACDDKAIYWAEASEGRILDVSRDGDTRVVVAGERVSHLVANATDLCWFSLDDEGNALVKCLDR